jgi:pimeloyl-ACP methyl ester carboxylesterase
MTYSALVAGLPVMFTDLAGYANFGAPNNPASGYALTDDSGRSMLDGARAFKKLFPQFSKKVNLVGHSLGGHTAMSALALSDSYLGADGEVAAVGVHSPFWIAQRAWGAILNSSVAQQLDLTFARTSFTAYVGIWYQYTHAELLDGPGEGVKLFKPQYRDRVKALVEGYCPGRSTPPDFGVTYLYEIFESPFAVSVGAVAAGIQPTGCGDDAVCTKWMARYAADRPRLTGNAAKVPIYLTIGSADATIPPARMRCATDWLAKDNAPLKVCYETGPDHTGIVGVTSERLVDFLKSKTLGTPEPAACESDIMSLPAACTTPPPNE